MAYDSSPAQMFHTQHPSGQEYARYLRIVAHMHELPVVLDTDVTAVTPIAQCQGDKGNSDHGHGAGFEVSISQSPEATRKLPPKIRAKFCIWAAGEFQYPRTDGFPGAGEHCVHNSSIRSWADLAKSSDEMAVIGGYESGLDATVHLANAGCDVTVLASTPFWSTRTLDPSTELAPFTAGRLQVARDGPNPPTLMGHTRVTQVAKDEQGGGYVVTAVRTSEAKGEIVSLQVRRASTGFGLFLKTEGGISIEMVVAGGAADQGGLKAGDEVVQIAGVQVQGAPHGLVEAMERVKSLSVRGQVEFEWKVRRDEADVDENKQQTTVQVKTKAKPILATGFKSGVGATVNHLFKFTAQSLCASGDAKDNNDKESRTLQSSVAKDLSTRGPEATAAQEALADATAEGDLLQMAELLDAGLAKVNSTSAVTVQNLDGEDGEDPEKAEPIEMMLTPLHIAAQVHNIEAVTLLLDRGAQPGFKAYTDSSREATPLIMAVMTSPDDADIVNLLIDRSADCLSCLINAVGPKSFTALDFACELGFEACKVALSRAALRVALRAGPSETVPAGDVKLNNKDESTICPGLFLCGPQVRQDDEIFCFVYKYRRKMAMLSRFVCCPSR